MAKFRKKPVVIEAERYVDRGRGLSTEFANAVHEDEEWVPWINTLEGRHRVSDGDFMIKGVKGEFYLCKPDIFEATYEAVV